jgi:hypothetical protein
MWIFSRKWIWPRNVAGSGNKLSRKGRGGKSTRPSSTGRPGSTALCALLVSHSYKPDTTFTRLTHTAHNKLKRHAPTHHYKFLCDRASNKLGEVSVAAQKAARRMLRQEKQRSDARHLKRILAKVQGGAITRIKVSEDGTYMEKTDRAEVELHTMAMCCAPHNSG